MSANYLITRPEHDDTTHYLSNWGKETVIEAEKRGLRVLDLHREKASKPEVESRLEKFSPALVVFNGHGNDDMVTGHGNQPLITAGENEGLLKSDIAYAISCKSAKGLGPKSVKAGAASYTGYDDDFIFFYTPEMISRPLQDGTARLFLEPSNLFITSLLKGTPVAEARRKTEGMLRDNIARLLGGGATDAGMARYLWWDLRHFVSHGDLNAKL